MKNKFERLSKQEKRDAINKFKESNDFNLNIYKKVKKLKTISIIGIVYSCLMFIFDFLYEYEIISINLLLTDFRYLNYIIDGLLIVFCVFFYLKARQMLIYNVNKYLISNK